jgi:energy-coupling factor transporter ATP-binding protein EcfA2
MQPIEINWNEKSSLDGIKLSETIDVNTLDKLIQSDYLHTDPWINPETGEKVCYDSEKQHLLALRKNIKNNTLSVAYKPSKLGVGRVYAQKSLSLGSIRRELRHTLARDTYTDIDMENCHPVILEQLCRMNNIECDYLTKYVTNRTKYLKEVMDKYQVTRDQAKNLFIRLLYFGNIENWKADNAIVADKDLVFLTKFYKELKCIGLEIVSKNPKLLKLIQKSGKANETASLVSTVLQHYEKKILECVYIYLHSEKVVTDNCVLCFDGIMIPSKNYVEGLLTQLSATVETQLHFQVVFTTKDMKQGYDLPDIENPDSFECKAKEFEKTHCKIVNKAVYLKLSQSGDEIIQFSQKRLQEAYCDVTCDENAGFISKWMNKNKNIRKYDDMNVYPHPLQCPENHFNLWIPFKYETCKDSYVPNTEGLEFVLNHLKIICDNDESVQQYVIMWMAQMLQFPAFKTCCLSFVGRQGSGKSSFIRICEALLGRTKVFESTAPSRDVWGDFNSPMINAFLVSIPELSKKDYIQGEAKFKGIITDPTIYINAKGINQYEINSYHRVVNTSNNDDPVKTSEDDRRNVVIRVSDELIGNKEYFDKLYEYLIDDTTMRALYDYLMKIPDMDKFNKIPLPRTKHQEELRKLDMSVPEQFLYELVAKSSEKELVYTADQMYSLFNSWKFENNVDFEINKLKMGMKLSVLRVDGFTSEHRKVGTVRVLNVDKMRQHFKIPNECMF